MCTCGAPMYKCVTCMLPIVTFVHILLFENVSKVLTNVTKYSAY
jgi:hypothetical protein